MGEDKIQMKEGARGSRGAFCVESTQTLQAHGLGSNRLRLGVSFHFPLIYVMGRIPPCGIVVVCEIPGK